ncbi:MAG: hypothetical protein RIR53_1456 [Bacteroidota bacterium]
MQDRDINRRRGGRQGGRPNDERQPLTNESAIGRPGRQQRPNGPGPSRPRFDDERQPLTSENPYTARSGRDDRRGGPRDDRRGGPRDDRRGGPRDDRRGGPRDDRGGGPRDDRRGGPRDDRRGGPRDDRRGGPRDDRRGGPRDDRRGGAPGRDRRPDRRPQGPHEGGFDRRPTFSGDERQPLSNESPALRGRAGGGARGKGGSQSRGRGGRGAAQGRGRTQGGRGQSSSGFGSPASKRKEREVRRSKAYVSDAFMYRENLDEAKPTERKMRSRRNKPSGGEVQGE